MNSLPGISLESIDKIANAEQITYLGVWNDVQDRSIAIFRTRLIEEFKKRYRLKTIRQAFNTGTRIDPMTTTAPATKLRGVVVELSCEDSPLRSISVDHVKIYLLTPTADPLPITVTDLDSGALLHSQTLLVADQLSGWNTVAINKSFASSRILIAYTGTQVVSTTGTLSDACCQEFAACAQRELSCSGLLSGCESATDLSLITYGNNTYGLSVVLSITCSFDGFICDNKDSFISAFWWLCGSEMMMERIYNGSRINKWTLNKEAATELKDYYHTEFERALSAAVEGVDLDACDCCLECNEQIQVREVLP